MPVITSIWWNGTLLAGIWWVFVDHEPFQYYRGTNGNWSSQGKFSGSEETMAKYYIQVPCIGSTSAVEPPIAVDSCL